MQFRHPYHPYFGQAQLPANQTGYPIQGQEKNGTYPLKRTDQSVPMGHQQEMGHTHGHGGATTCVDGHTHLHPGVTGTPIQTENGHVHKIYGYTTFDDGHIHSYEAYTSPPIQLPNGFHTHYAEIRTTENGGHTHIIKGFTEPSKS